MPSNPAAASYEFTKLQLHVLGLCACAYELHITFIALAGSGWLLRSSRAETCRMHPMANVRPISRISKRSSLPYDITSRTPRYFAFNLLQSLASRKILRASVRSRETERFSRTVMYMSQWRNNGGRIIKMFTSSMLDAPITRVGHI